VAVVAIYAGLTYRHWRDEALWRVTSEKLGRDYEITTRDDITSRVGQYLRRQWLTGALVSNAVIVLLVLMWAGMRHSHSPSLISLVVVVLTTGVLAGVIVSSRRLWNRSAGAGRVAHLARPPVRQTFAPAERALLGGGFVFAAVGGCWGLWQEHGPALAALWAVVVVSDVSIAWWGLAKVLNRPARAHDDLELAWDDVLRHKEARDLAASLVWTPALVASLFAMHSLLASGNLLPFYAIAIAGFVIAWTFRRGRNRWQALWDGSTPPT